MAILVDLSEEINQFIKDGKLPEYFDYIFDKEEEDYHLFMKGGGKFSLWEDAVANVEFNKRLELYHHFMGKLDEGTLYREHPVKNENAWKRYQKTNEFVDTSAAEKKRAVRFKDNHIDALNCRVAGCFGLKDEKYKKK